MGKKGFTLVELMVSLSIFSLLLGTIFSVFGNDLNYLMKSISRSEKQQIANMVLLRITSDIKQAREILSSSSCSVLALNMGTENIEYSLTENKVKRKQGGYSMYLTDKGDIQSLSFSYPSKKMAGVKIDAFNVQAHLRN